jgi:AcrR family transcriptional regulator
VFHAITVLHTEFYGQGLMTSEFGSSGDPRRTLALLWGTREAPTRGPKPGLTPERIVAAAVALADAEGLAALSMRRVAQALGVGTMSLYTYVPGKDELLDVMLDTVVAETGQGDDDAGGWRERLERVARANRALYARHPWLLEVASVRPVLGPNVMAKYERELRTIDGIGLSDLEIDAVLGLVLAHVEGVARRAHEKVLAERRTGMSEDEWWAAYAPALAEVGDFSRFPTAARVGAAAGEAHGAYDPDHAFEFGLARVLDGIEALVRARADDT